MAFEITSDTVVKILVRRGLEVERLDTLLSEGELGYSVDTRRLFIGDGYNLGGNPVSNLNFGNVLNIQSYLPYAMRGDTIKSNNLNYILGTDQTQQNGWVVDMPGVYTDAVSIGGTFYYYNILEYAPDPDNRLRIRAGSLGDGFTVDYLFGGTGSIASTIQNVYSTLNFDARFISLCAFRSVNIPNDSYRIGSLYFGDIFTSTTKNNLSATVNVEKNLSINDHTLSAYQLQMYARDLNVNNSLIDATSGSLYIRSRGPIYLGTNTAGGSGLSISDTNVTVYGNLSVLGDLAYLNSVVSVTSALSVVNNGTGPAFVVNQKGTQPVAHFQDDGATALYIADGGNVGLGTSNPGGALEVKGNGGSGAGRIRISNSSDPALEISNSTTVKGYLYYDTTGADTVNLRHATGGVSQFTLASNGNAGIGTSSPAAKLEVSNGTVNFQVAPDSGTSRVVIGPSTNHSLAFQTNAATGMTINASGNVGIATTLPQEKLTVSGNISSNGTLFTKQMTAYGLDLVHTPITDGTDAVLRIGESNYDSPNLGFSGAFMSYDELTNVFGISSVFADGITQHGTPAFAVDRLGNVGVGTMTPITKFEVNGSMRVGRGNDMQFNGALKWGSTNGGNDASSYMSGFANSIEQIRIDASGLKVSDSKSLTLGAGTNIALDTATGSTIGTATSQKLGFYGITPKIQPSSANQAAVAAYVAGANGYSTAAQAQAIITLVNEIRTTLVNLGLMKGSA